MANRVKNMKEKKTKTKNASKIVRMRIVAGVSSILFIMVVIFASGFLPDSDTARELAGVYGTEDKQTETSSEYGWGKVPAGNGSEIKTNAVVTYYDVGQADATLIQLPNKKHALIDAGDGTTSDIVGMLREKNIVEIDYLILTHPHADHIGGAAAVLENFEVRSIYMPRISTEMTPTTATYENLLKTISKLDKKIKAPDQGDIIDAQPQTSMKVVSVKSPNWTDLNDYSICVQLDIGNVSFLFMGDAELESIDAIMKTTAITADVLKVGHHGSDTSSPDAFIDYLDPQIAIISCGTNNKYGHPHNKTLKTLAKHGTTTYRTDLHGTVVVKTDGNTLSTTTEYETEGEGAA